MENVPEKKSWNRPLWWIVALLLIVAIVGFAVWERNTPVDKPADEVALIEPPAVVVPEAKITIFDSNVSIANDTCCCAEEKPVVRKSKKQVKRKKTVKPFVAKKAPAPAVVQPVMVQAPVQAPVVVVPPPSKPKSLFAGVDTNFNKTKFVPNPKEEVIEEAPPVQRVVRYVVVAPRAPVHYSSGYSYGAPAFVPQPQYTPSQYYVPPPQIHYPNPPPYVPPPQHITGPSFTTGPVTSGPSFTTGTVTPAPAFSTGGATSGPTFTTR